MSDESRRTRAVERLADASQHFQSQAVTMLTIATVMLGFGFFKTEFCISMELLHMYLSMIKLGIGLFAVYFYVRLWRSVRIILERSVVTGRDVVEGPLYYTVLVALCVITVFFIDNIDGPAGSVYCSM